MESTVDAVRSYTVPPMSLKDPALARLFGEGYQTAAGVPVTDGMIFTFSAVYDAVNQSSSDLATLPLNLRIRRQNGGSDLFESSKTYWLLKYEANRDMSAFEFRRTLQAHALTCKGAFAEIERNGAGQAIALWPLTPDRVVPFIVNERLATGRSRGILKYRIDGDNKNIIEAANMIHIRGLGYDGYCAYPIIDKARQAIGLALAAERFAGAFFGNNANLGGVLASDQDLDPEQAKDVQERINQVHKGPDKAWKMLVLGAGFKYFRTGVTPSESQMNDLRDKQVEEVARFFNFPLHKLKNLTRSTNNNIEQQNREYYTGHQLNWITNWEGELNRKLVPSLEVGNQYFKHSAKGVLRGDTAAQTAFYTAMLDRGVFCADDVLEYEDLNPQSGGQGKIFLVQGAMVPKDQIVDLAKGRVEMVKAQTEKLKQPPPPPAAPAAPAATDQQVEDANNRAAAAEQAASEARSAAQVARETLVAAEATGVANAAEIATLRQDVERACVIATQSTALATEMRADAESARQRAADAETGRLEAIEQAREQERLRTDADGRVAAAEVERARLEGETQAAQDRAVAAASEMEAAQQRAADAEIARVAAADAAAALVAAATDRTTAADAERVRQADIAEAAVAAATAAQADADTARRLAAELQTAADAATGDRATAEQARDAAAAALAVAEARALDAATDRDGALARLEQATADAVSARTEADAATADALARAVAADARAAGADAARLAAEQAMDAATAGREALDAQIAGFAQERDAARVEAVELGSAVAALREQVSTVTLALADVRSAHETALSAVQVNIEALTRDRDDARELAAERDAAIAASASVIRERETEIRTVRQADADAMSGLIAAHRGLVVEVMRKAVERETDRARRAQQTPEKLRQWVDTFYDGHAELMRQALLPAMRIHLAFVRSAEDPVEATRRAVAAHVADSERQIRTVLDGDADDLAASLPALLHRWDTERSTVLADSLMTKELAYARSI